MSSLRLHCGYSLVASAFFQPTRGGKETRAEKIQTKAIIKAALEGVLFFRYFTAWVMLQKRSRLMRKRLFMLAVQRSTSKAA